MLHDVFISHASEDKEDFARPLAARLREHRLEVWYDEFSLNVGDSLRRSIDRGLAQSRFGIVVLSPAFIAKHWSQWELDGLVARQNSGEHGLVLPIWHGIGRNEVMAYSPSLADRLAVDTTVGMDEVVRRLLAVIQPQGSTLVIARDHLLRLGLEPPVISDDWWLDVAAFSESNGMEGGFQEAMGWGRWGFPLPWASPDPVERGWRLAKAALQMNWQDAADEQQISQVTRPEAVHEFISAQPGLLDACHENIRYLITYAPQLTIPGNGGVFEAEIESLYRESVERGERRRLEGYRGGTALTLDGRAPGVGEEYALRDPEFGQYSASLIACGFVQGDSVSGGPPCRAYEPIDYAAWALSEESGWLPPATREVLRNGIAEWGVWPWTGGGRAAVEHGFEEQEFTGDLFELLVDAPNYEGLVVSESARQDAVHRLGFSARLLNLPEDGETLCTRLLAPSFLERYFVHRAERSERRSQMDKRIREV